MRESIIFEMAFTPLKLKFVFKSVQERPIHRIEHACFHRIDYLRVPLSLSLVGLFILQDRKEEEEKEKQGKLLQTFRPTSFKLLTIFAVSSS